MASTLSLYHETCTAISKTVIRKYSTSFYLSSLLFSKNIRNAIFTIYGFVRLADEIVDTFHEYDKETLFKTFETDTYLAIKHGISLNPVLHAFQKTVHEYNLDTAFIEAFFKSMHFDLHKKSYTTTHEINEYIYGSAEVIGLMCLRVFCNSNQEFEKLKQPAIKLGAAFQKVNFLRDLHNDIATLQRMYFPNLLHHEFTETVKQEIITDIANDFNEAYKGITLLPRNSQLAVFTAFLYYKTLLNTLQQTPAQQIAHKRIRVNNIKKILLICKAYSICKLRLL